MKEFIDKAIIYLEKEFVEGCFLQSVGCDVGGVLFCVLQERNQMQRLL